MKWNEYNVHTMHSDYVKHVVKSLAEETSRFNDVRINFGVVKLNVYLTIDNIFVKETWEMI